jgi:hypothetical protein
MDQQEIVECPQVSNRCSTVSNRSPHVRCLEESTLIRLEAMEVTRRIRQKIAEFRVWPEASFRRRAEHVRLPNCLDVHLLAEIKASPR